jgi:hypothetical protein
MKHKDGWFGLVCWNGLSVKQQTELIERGVLEIGYVPRGWCDRPAEVQLETRQDKAPGPRFYCLRCAAMYLQAIAKGEP